MRYKLDANGYILAVYFGCYSGTGQCAEYTGTVPNGYTDLNDWSENALINAYYIEKGNLVLDSNRLKELEAKIEQDSIDNEPIVRKDLYGSTDVLNEQYQSVTAKGQVIVANNVKKINPKVKITDIECYNYNKIDIITQGKNMLRNDGITETIDGVKFTRLINGGIKISGTAIANIEYNLSGSSENAASIFSLKKGVNYYLNIGSLDCELKYYDGTTSQVYVGDSGLINLSESKEVTQVLIKIPIGTTIEETIYPMLECGSSASAYEEYKHRILTIDFSEFISEDVLFPSDDLYPSDDLHPMGTTINSIYVEDGSIYASVDGIKKYLTKGNVNLFDGYNVVYVMQDANLEMTYNINELLVDDLSFLQGKATTTNKFKILEDGSIEAHNGYFSGEVQATSGKFVGEVQATSGTFTGALKGSEMKGGTIESANFDYAKKTGLHIDLNTGDITSFNGITLNGNSGYGTSIDGKKLRTSKIEVINELDGSIGTEIYQEYVKTYSYQNFSKEELKKNFEAYKDALDKIKNTDIYKYNYKVETNGTKKHIGCVIGSKYKCNDDILTSNKDGIDLYSMVSVLWQGVKEQQEIIEELKEEIKQLKESDN